MYKSLLFAVLISIPNLWGADLADLAKRETRESLAANPPAPVGSVESEKPATKRPVLILMLAQVGAAIADVEMTQACIRKGTCVEANLFMPSNRAGQYGIKGGMIVASSFTGLGLRRSQNKWLRRLWWIPQAVNIGASLYGMSTGLRYR